MADPNHTTIAHRSREVKQSLLDLISQVHGIEPTEAGVSEAQVADALDRFILWAGNLGALHDPAKKLSLDYRLQDAPDILSEVLDLLADVQEAVEDLASIVSGEKPNRALDNGSSQGEIGENTDVAAELEDLVKNQLQSHEPGLTEVQASSPASEAQVILEVMSQCLRSLFRIAVLVRKSNPPGRDRFQRALQQSNLAFPEIFDVDYVTNKYDKLSLPQTRWLGKRLGAAIAKRRQFIKYCRDHKSRLAFDDEDIFVEVDAAATERLSSKATTFLKTQYVDAEALQAKLEAGEDDALSLMTAVTAFDPDNMLRLPRLADLSPNGQPFECPICFTFQTFLREKAWKTHAFRDLKPYVCTVGGSGCKNELFDDRDAWFEHELQQHRSQYLCPLCDDVRYNSKARMEAHLSTNHGSFQEKQLVMLLDQARQVPAQFNAEDCPFCDEWAQTLRDRVEGKGKSPAESPRGGPSGSATLISPVRFKRHVATHQEQLAIFAVPRSSEQARSNDSHSVESDSSTGLSVDKAPIANRGANFARFSEEEILSASNDSQIQQNLRNIRKVADTASETGSVQSLSSQEASLLGGAEEDHNEEDEYPKRGKTRIPRKLVSVRAIEALGYQYENEGNTIIIKVALGQNQINDLLKLSEDYNKETDTVKGEEDIEAEIQRLEKELEQRRKQLRDARKTENDDHAEQKPSAAQINEPEMTLDEEPPTIINVHVDRDSDYSEYSSQDGQDVQTGPIGTDGVAVFLEDSSSGERKPENVVELAPEEREGKWTEITKDLVVAGAIEQMGYEYEETEWYFYVKQYLEYEQVKALVDLSETLSNSQRATKQGHSKGRSKHADRESRKDAWERQSGASRSQNDRTGFPRVLPWEYPHMPAPGRRMSA